MMIRASMLIFLQKNSNTNERLVLSMGFSFVAVLLLASVTKGQVSLLSEKFVFPLYAGSKDCDISIEFNTMSFSSGALAITMTTNYNETVVNVLDKAPFVLPLKQFLSINVTKVFTFDVNYTVTATLHMPDESVMPIYSPSAMKRNYIISIDQGYSLVIFTEEDTNVTIDHFQNTSTNQYIFGRKRVLTFSPDIDGHYRINSSRPIGIVYSNIDLNDGSMCSNVTQLKWEMVPPTAYSGKEFLFHVPPLANVVLEIFGYEEGQLTIHTTEEVILKDLKAFERLIVNVTSTRDVFLSSTINTKVDVMTAKLGGDVNKVNLFPVVGHSDCSYFKAENCSNNICGYLVYKVSASTPNFTIYDRHGATVRTISDESETGNLSVGSFPVSDLPGGHYFINTYDDTPFVFFRFNSINGQYFQTIAVNSSVCHLMTKTSTIDVNDKLVSYDVTTENNTDGSTGAFKNEETLSVTSLPLLNVSDEHTAAQIVPKVGPRMYLTSNSSANDSTVVQQIDNRLIFPFMYEEIPEDDNVLNEYLIAVIVSLCTAICAVIGVISTFLLLEFLRRRRHVGNTKIRPFVS